MLIVNGRGKVELVKTPTYNTPYNTGKVKIGIAVSPKPRPINSSNEISLQRLLLN